MDALTEGVELTLKQLVGALSKFGVKAVESVGQVFDPVHNRRSPRCRRTRFLKITLWKSIKKDISSRTASSGPPWSRYRPGRRIKTVRTQLVSRAQLTRSFTY